MSGVSFSEDETSLLIESIERNMSYNKSRIKQKQSIPDAGNYNDCARREKILDLEYKQEQLNELLSYILSELSF